MNAAALETGSIQQLAHFRGRVLLINVGRAAIAPELDALVTDPAQRFQRFGRIAGEFAPNRVELESNRNGLGRVGREGEGSAQGHAERTAEGRFDKPTTCRLHKGTQVDCFASMMSSFSTYCVQSNAGFNLNFVPLLASTEGLATIDGAGTECIAPLHADAWKPFRRSLSRATKSPGRTSLRKPWTT